MARLNITFASLDATNKTRPQSTAEGMTYAQGLVVEGSLAATNDKDVYKVVHTDPVADATLPSLMAWIEANVPDYTNKLYEVYIPEIKTSNTALSPTGKANTVYSFTGTKQSDHSMIARATVTAHGTDEYPVGTVLECIIQPDLTKTDWRVVNSVSGIIEVATTTSAASRNALMQTADVKANGRDNYTIIFDSVTFTNAAESPTHSTTDIFWVEVIKTDDRIFIRTSAAINQGGTYFNRVYYSRMDLDTEAWSDWTPYNFQIMDIALFAGAAGTYNIPTIYWNEVMQRSMIFKYSGNIMQKLDSTTMYVADNDYVYRFVAGTADATTGLTPVTLTTISRHVIFANAASGTITDDQAWLIQRWDIPFYPQISGVVELSRIEGTPKFMAFRAGTYYEVSVNLTNKTFTKTETAYEPKGDVRELSIGFNDNTGIQASKLHVIKHNGYSEVFGQIKMSITVNANSGGQFYNGMKINGIAVNGNAVLGALPGGNAAGEIGVCSFYSGSGAAVLNGGLYNWGGNNIGIFVTSDVAKSIVTRISFHFVTTQSFF